MPVPTRLQAYVRPGSLNSPDNTEYRFSLAADGADRFRIRYYGELYDGLITDTEDAPARIVAVEPESGREILLFDGGRHGYNAMLCDEHDEETLENRTLQDLDDALYQIEIRAFLWRVSPHGELEQRVRGGSQQPTLISQCRGLGSPPY